MKLPYLKALGVIRELAIQQVLKARHSRNSSRPPLFVLQMGKVGAKMVSHGPYGTLRLAEVAVPRELFRKILSLIMICDQGPLRRRPGKSTARRKRQERCVWMTRKLAE